MWLQHFIGELATGYVCSLRFLAGAVILGWLTMPVAAQTLTAADRAALEARKNELFQQTLNRPADLDVIFDFADVSARLGDNEAAVTALERMLLFNPNLTRVQLELGVLYFRMQSFELARSYFEKALAANPPPEVKTRVDQYLREMTVVDSRERITGYVFFGAQHQTDANAAPGSPLIHSPVGDALLSSQFVKQADTNIFGAGSALYTYDLRNQDRDAIEVLGSGFANHYFKVSRLDLTLAELDIGPRRRDHQQPDGRWVGRPKRDGDDPRRRRGAGHDDGERRRRVEFHADSRRWRAHAGRLGDGPGRQYRHGLSDLHAGRDRAGGHGIADTEHRRCGHQLGNSGF